MVNPSSTQAPPRYNHAKLHVVGSGVTSAWRLHICLLVEYLSATAAVSLGRLSFRALPQVMRIQLACAAYKHAWHLRADGSMASQALQEGRLTLQEARWMRAQWLLARTLCAALFNVRVVSCSLLCSAQR